MGRACVCLSVHVYVNESSLTPSGLPCALRDLPCVMSHSGKLSLCREQFREGDWPLPVVPSCSCHPACHRTPATPSPTLLPADLCAGPSLSQNTLLAFFTGTAPASSFCPIQGPSLEKPLRPGWLGSRVPNFRGKVYARCQNGGFVCMRPAEGPASLSSLPASGWPLTCAPADAGGG